MVQESVVKNVTIFSRTNCHLCDRAYDVMKAIAQDYPMMIQKVDIDTDPNLVARFGDTVPAIEIDALLVAEGRVSEYRLRRHLGIPATPRQWLGLGRSLI